MGSSGESFPGLVKKVWKQEREAFMYPPLAAEILDTNDISFPSITVGEKVLINKRFIDKFNFSTDLTKQDLVSVVIARELNRYIRIPKNFYQKIKLYLAVKSVVYRGEYARLFLDIYLDISNDLNLAKQGYAKKLKNVYKISSSMQGPSFGNEQVSIYQVLLGLMEKKLNADFSLNFDVAYRPLISELSKIDYARNNQRGEDVRKFSALLSRYFGYSQEGKSNDSTGSGASETGYDEGQEEKSKWPIGLPQIGYRNMGDGISGALSQKTGSNGNLLNSIDQLVNEMTRLPNNLRKYDGVFGRWQLYLEKARRFSIVIREKEDSNIRRTYPLYHLKWLPGDSIERLDPIASFGKLTLPGIAKRWVYSNETENEFDRHIDLPDLLVVHDSSGSMVDPNRRLSLATLASCACALSYIENGASVAVYNFSSEDKVVDFTRDKTKVCKHIVDYQAGGTSLSVDTIESLLSKRNGDIDILAVTDMGLSSMDVLDEIARYQGAHRLFVVLPQNSRHTKEAKEKLQNTNFYSVETEEDIQGLVMSTTGEST